MKGQVKERGVKKWRVKGFEGGVRWKKKSCFWGFRDSCCQRRKKWEVERV